jgi:hypothetical protein
MSHNDNDHNNKSSTQYDWRRTVHVGIVGLLWAGPAQHTWYNVLERTMVLLGRLTSAAGGNGLLLFGGTTIITKGGGLVTRLVLDATVFTPFTCTYQLYGTPTIIYTQNSIISLSLNLFHPTHPHPFSLSLSHTHTHTNVQWRGTLLAVVYWRDKIQQVS